MSRIYISDTTSSIIVGRRRHDPIANLMGANSMGSFKESEPKLFREFRAAFSGYHKHCLNSMRNVSANNPSDAGNGNQTVFNNADVLDSSLTMEVGPGLFPRLKNGWSQHYNKMKKSIKESMLRIYLNAQYCKILSLSCIGPLIYSIFPSLRNTV